MSYTRASLYGTVFGGFTCCLWSEDENHGTQRKLSSIFMVENNPWRVSFFPSTGLPFPVFLRPLSLMTARGGGAGASWISSSHTVMVRTWTEWRGFLVCFHLRLRKSLQMMLLSWEVPTPDHSTPHTRADAQKSSMSGPFVHHRVHSSQALSWEAYYSLSLKKKSRSNINVPRPTCTSCCRRNELLWSVAGELFIQPSCNCAKNFTCTWGVQTTLVQTIELERFSSTRWSSVKDKASPLWNIHDSELYAFCNGHTCRGLGEGSTMIFRGMY